MNALHAHLDVAAMEGMRTSLRSAGTERMPQAPRECATMMTTPHETAVSSAGSGDTAALGAADFLCLAAAPTFAIMALLTGVLGGGAPDMLCSAARDASPFGGMVAMYLLMSAFHSAPWLRLISGRRSGVAARG